jgi:hypothetical protein
MNSAWYPGESARGHELTDHEAHSARCSVNPVVALDSADKAL